MSAPAATPAPAAAPLAVPGVLSGVVGRLKEGSSAVLKQQKPWSEVLDRTVISKPESFGEAIARIKRNAAYFRVNYFLVMLATCVVTFVMNPSSLFVLGVLLAGWIYVLFIRQTPIVISGRTISDREKLMGMAAISFVTIFFLTSVGTIFFSALTLSLAVIMLHGAFREPDNLFIDETEGQQSFVSILTGAPASGGIASV